jgi:hypothetical protein
MSIRMGAVEGWVVTRDGETLKTGFKSESDAFGWLQRHQSQSIDWAIRYAGYDIVRVLDGKVVRSYRKEMEARRSLESPEQIANDFEHAVRRAFIDVYGEPKDLSIVERSIRSSYLEKGRRQGWTEPSPNVVLVGTEYAWVPDMFASEEDWERWSQVAELLKSRGWRNAWFDSVNAGVHIVYWMPESNRKTAPSPKRENPELGSRSPQRYHACGEKDNKRPPSRVDRKRGGGRMGMFPESEKSFFTRLESVWGEEE